MDFEKIAKTSACDLGHCFEGSGTGSVQDCDAEGIRACSRIFLRWSGLLEACHDDCRLPQGIWMSEKGTRRCPLSSFVALPGLAKLTR